jgi:hypothetical protein
VRGWQEFNGTMDGFVYGACAGLGFATANEVRAELLFASMPLAGEPVGLFSGVVTIALRGLADGVLGALIGAGIGAATEARSFVGKLLLPFAGLFVAVVAHAGYVELAHGNALSGMEGLVRSQIALVLPIVALVAIIAYALRRERKAMDTQLPAEQETGAVTPEELATLRSWSAKNRAYWKALGQKDLRRWTGLKALHNRQAQLALLKEKSSRQINPQLRASAEEEVRRVREAIFEQKRALGLGLEQASKEVAS